MRGRGGGRTRRGRGGSSCDRRCGVFASGDFVWEKSTPACVVVRQLWRGNKTCRLRVSRQLRCPKVSKGRAESPLVRPQAHTPCHGGEGRADYGAGVGLAVSWGAHTFLSMAKEKCAKESQRHGDYRGGPPRCASRASVCGSRTVGRPEFIRGVQFRPLGRNSLTTFRGQTALRGCPRPRLAALTRRKKALIAHFDGGARNVARNGVG